MWAKLTNNRIRYESIRNDQTEGGIIMDFEMLENYPDIMTPEEVMEALGIRRNLFYQLVNDGSLKASRIGNKLWLISKKNLLDFLEENEKIE